MPTYDQLKQTKQQAFQQADQAGDAILPQQWGHVVGLLQREMDDVDPQQAPQTAQIVGELSGLLVESQPMSFAQMDQYRDALEATGEEASEQLVDIIDKALEGMGAANPNLKEAIPASKGIRMRKGLAKLLAAALSYKQQNGTDMLSAVKQAVAEQGIESFPVEDRKMIQNMLLTGDTSQFAAFLEQDAGGQGDGGLQEMEPNGFR